MSAATTNLHQTVKKPGEILFTASVAFFGFAIFPIGIALYFALSYVNRTYIHWDHSLPFIIVLAVGVLAALYTIIEDISRMLNAHKLVLQELLKSNEEIVDDTEEIWDRIEGKNRSAKK